MVYLDLGGGFRYFGFIVGRLVRYLGVHASLEIFAHSSVARSYIYYDYFGEGGAVGSGIFCRAYTSIFVSFHGGFIRVLALYGGEGCGILFVRPYRNGGYVHFVGPFFCGGIIVYYVSVGSNYF